MTQAESPDSVVRRSPREPIYGLDLLRLFAAISVMIYHFAFKPWASPGNPLMKQMGHGAALPSWWAVSWWGWIGVQVFFVISGMVISYSSEGVSAGAFARKRALRLWPAILISATLALIVAIPFFDTAVPEAVRLWAKTLFFVPVGPWIMGQFWTLPIEVCFYVVIWLMILVGGVRRLEALAWVLAGACALYWTGFTWAATSDPFGRYSQLLLLQHGCFFALGMVLTLAKREGVQLRHYILALLCVYGAAFQIRAAAYGERLIGGIAELWMVAFAIWLGFVALAVLSVAGQKWIGRIAAPYAGAIRMIGLMTYPLYLLHIHVGGPVLTGLVGAGAHVAVALGGAFLAGLAAAYVVARWLEPAVYRRLRTATERIGRPLRALRN